MTSPAALCPAPSEPTLWVPVCRLSEMPPERGVAALVHGEQVALVRTHDEQVFAVQQGDPYSAAMVMSRGLVGSRRQRPTIASPMFKQVFDLATGECLDPVGKEPIALRTWPIRVENGVVSIGLSDRAET
ncbi:MAG: nitrite reductase small subunit NirD [Tetrasphaera sp.]